MHSGAGAEGPAGWLREDGASAAQGAQVALACAGFLSRGVLRTGGAAFFLLVSFSPRGGRDETPLPREGKAEPRSCLRASA